MPGDTALNNLDQSEAAEKQSGKHKVNETKTIKWRFRVCQIMQRFMLYVI